MSFSSAHAVGIYAKDLEKLGEKWKDKSVHLKISTPLSELRVQTIQTPNDSIYLGMLARGIFPGDLKALQKTFEDFPDYIHLYPDLEKIEASPAPSAVSTVQTSSFPQVIAWQFKAPFGRHISYKTVQTLTRPEENKLLILYRLDHGTDVLESDGILFAEAVDGKIKYLSVDFFKGDFGTFAKLFKSKIWETSCENVFNTTKAILKKSGSSVKNEKLIAQDLSSCSHSSEREKSETFEKLSANLFD